MNTSLAAKLETGAELLSTTSFSCLRTSSLQNTLGYEASKNITDSKRTNTWHFIKGNFPAHHQTAVSSPVNVFIRELRGKLRN